MAVVVIVMCSMYVACLCRVVDVFNALQHGNIVMFWNSV